MRGEWGSMTRVTWGCGRNGCCEVAGPLLSQGKEEPSAMV
jgi:hypothetical protein